MKSNQLASALIATTLAMALGGCGGGEKKQQGAGTAGGEVLPAAASDAMLPLDTVRSQAPLAPKSAEAGDSKPSKAKPADGDGAESDAPQPSTSASPQQD